MRIQLIHLSDMHFDRKDDIFAIDVEKMSNALKSIEKADKCIIVLSGDLVAKGKGYGNVDSFIGAIFKFFGRNNYKNEKIEIVCVPGNHDIDFSDLNVTTRDISKAYSGQNVANLMNVYIDKMNRFFSFSRNRKCFMDDTIICKKEFLYSGKKVGFILLNSAPLSLLGGDSADMGMHYLSNKQIDRIEKLADEDFNILVMHHSLEWFQSECKNRLRKIISKKFLLVLTGHEHEPVGEVRNINGTGELQYIQGNALYGNSSEGNGFCVINIDIDNEMIKAYSCIWNNEIYVSKEIASNRINACMNFELTVKKEFLEELSVDDYKREYDKYYVFPSLVYSTYTENDVVEKHEIETEDELFELISSYKKVVVSGEHKSGKSLLAKRMYLLFLKQRKIPILINAEEIVKKKIEKTLEYAFVDQYMSEHNAYEKFLQMNKNRKVVLLDGAELLNENTFNKLLSFLDDNCSQIIIFSEEKINLNIRKQVVDAMVEENLQIAIKPFLYVKRKKLINNILSYNMEDIKDVEKETMKINNLINIQVKYFNLDPEFIINFVNQYERDYKFQFTSGMNVFNVVYESSIKNRIIANAKNIEATLVTNVLRDLAYYMHFKKKNKVTFKEISEVVENYCNEYRQKINVRLFLVAGINAKILIESVDGIRFRDHTLIAYFVAQALNQKFNQGENIEENFEHLLRNLCFSINSDIVLFMALITNNPKFLNIVIDGAEKHFSNQDEMSFDNKNVGFLMNTSIPIKNSVPNKKEKEQREEAIAKQEEEAKLNDLIELVNEYDYSDEDLNKIENQVMISFKYLEILSKALPAFCQNMKVAQQDKLVSLLYQCPNQFLYMLLGDISENFDEFCNVLYEDVSELRKERNVVNVSLESVKRMIKQVASGLVIALYQLVAVTCSSEQSIAALNAFDYEKNSNYKLQNLMMYSQVGEINSFSKRAQLLDKAVKEKLEKSIVKYTVREYFLRNNVEIYGEAQSLFDHFFTGKSNQNLKIEMAKRRWIEKDRT